MALTCRVEEPSTASTPNVLQSRNKRRLGPISDIVEKSECPGGALVLRRVRQVRSGEPDVVVWLRVRTRSAGQVPDRDRRSTGEACRSISTLLITHSLTNHKIVGKLHTKPECFLNRCAS